jgi:pimeloyl-ACP methyl ester carboxylesterase
MSAHKSPKTILFVQHGMTDLSGNQTIERLANIVATEKTLIVAPHLHWVKTLFYLEPLIQDVETVARDTLAQYPDVPVRIIATSMGGVLWVEILARHPEWWSRVHSLILLGAPIGGAHLARRVDPLGWGIGIARDLGISRRAIAEKIAAAIPTLVVASDMGEGDDGIVSVESTKVRQAQFVCLSDVTHSELRIHPAVVAAIRAFWEDLKAPLPMAERLELSEILVERVQMIPGMTDAHGRHFSQSKPYLVFQNGAGIHVWVGIWGIPYVFVRDEQGQCAYGGFVGWLHLWELYQGMESIKTEFSQYL